MPPHIWQSRPLPTPSEPPSAPADSSDPLPSPPPPPPVWAPADIPAYDTPASSLPNLPTIPTLRPTPVSASPSPGLNTNSNTTNNNSTLDPDADALFRRFLDIRINDQSPQPSLDQVHRSASLHSQSYRPSQHHHHRSAAAARLLSASTHDLRADAPLARYLASSSDILSLSQPGPAANHPVYTPAAASSSVDVGPAPRGSPILRPSSVPASSPAVAPPLAMGALPPATQSGTRIKNELYKTEICRSYAESGGYCKYGAKCQFAHGDIELRPVRRHPRYKTKLCRNFVTTGSCPYDARCRFIHANDLPYGQAVTPGVGQTPANPMSGSSAGSLAHHAQLRAGQALLGGEAQHSVNVQDDYADNLRFLNLESSLNAAANHLDHYVDSINADQRSAASPPGELQTDKSIHSVLPTDQVYHANANVFQDYPDNNAFHNTFMHLSGVDTDVRFAPSDLSNLDPIHTTHHLLTKTVTNPAVGENGGAVGGRFASTSDPQHESLFSHPGTTNRAVSPPGSATKGTIGSRVGKGTEFVEGDTHVAPASSPVSRSRLPVFRNMTADDDAP